MKLAILAAAAITLVAGAAYATGHFEQSQLGKPGVTPPPTSMCPYGNSLGDGCPGAPANGSVQHSNFFTGYGAQSGQTWVSSSFTGAISGSVLTISGVPAGTSATASWSAGATSISVPSSLGLTAGLVVYDTTLGKPIGVIKSYSGTTIALNPYYAQYGSSGSTDALVFQVVATGNETIQGSGIPAGVYISSLGSGTGGNGTYNLANATGVSESESMTAVRRPAYNICGVDYGCGDNEPNTGWLDPAVTAIPGCSYSPTANSGNPQLTCAGSSFVGFNNFELGPIGGHVSVKVEINASSLSQNVLLSNDDWNSDGIANSFANGQFMLDIYNAPPSGTCITVKGNSFNGNWDTVNFGTFAQSFGCFNVEYTTIINTPGRPLSYSAVGYDGFTLSNSYVENFLNQGDAQGHGEAIVFAGTALSYKHILNDVFLQATGQSAATAPIFGLNTGGGYPDSSDLFESNVAIANLGCGQCSSTGTGLGFTINNLSGGVGDVMTITSIPGGTTLGLGASVQFNSGGPQNIWPAFYVGQNLSIGSDPNGLGSEWSVATTNALGNCSPGPCAVGDWGANITVSGATWSSYTAQAAFMQINDGVAEGPFVISNNYVDIMGSSFNSGFTTTTSLTCASPITWSGNYNTITGALIPTWDNGTPGTGCNAAPLTPPSITPAVSSAYDVNSALGGSNNSLFPATASAELPSNTANSWFYVIKGTVDNNPSPVFNYENMLGYGSGYQGMVVLTSGYGPPMLNTQFTRFGTSFHWWNGVSGTNMITGDGVNTAGAPNQGTGYNNGLLPWTATGGGCAREPAGWYSAGLGSPSAQSMAVVDPGFNCNTTPWLVPESIAGLGSQQTLATGATSCVSNSPVSGEMTVTTTTAVAHGVYPGQTGLTLSGFSGAGNTGYNATNYVALAGTTGTTLVLETTTGGGTCPAHSPDTSGGLALVGGVTTPATTYFPTIDNNTALNQTGIQATRNQKICLVLGEYGADSPTPGVQFFRALDGKTGTDLYGSPAVPAILNQGATNFTGYIVAGAQNATNTFTASITAGGVMNVTAINGGGTPFSVGTVITGPSLPTTTIASLGSGTGGTGTYNLTNTSIGQALPSSAFYNYHNYAPALHVTALNYYTITNAVYASTNLGQVTFTTSAAHGLTPGSIFDVGVTSAGGSNVSPSGYNGRYIAITGTTGSTIVGTPISTAAGQIQTISLANPGTYVSGGSEASEVMPGTFIVGGFGSTISPFGTYSSTGTGLLGTYALATDQPTSGFTFTAGTGGSPSTSLVVSAQPGTGSFEYLTAGVGFTGTGVSGGTYINSVVTGGGTGTYTLNQNATSSGGTTMTTDGNIWTSGSPGNLYAAAGMFFTPAPNSSNGGKGQLTAVSNSTLGSPVISVGSNSTQAAANFQQWGGNISDWSINNGVFPQDTSGNPSLTSMQSLCNRTTDIQAFDSTNSITTQANYRLSDVGIWGDSSNATIKGYITGASGTTATLNVSSTVFGSLALATGTQTAYLTGPGLAGGNASPPTISLTTSSSSTYTVTWGSSIAANLGSSGQPVTFSVGKNVALAPTLTGLINGYITASGGSGACASGPCLHVPSFQTGAQYWAGTTSYAGGNQIGDSGVMTVLSTTTGTLAGGQLCYGTNITGPPMGIASGSSSTWQMTGNYQPAYNDSSDSGSTYCTSSSITPNQTIIASTAVPYPIQITGFANGATGGLTTGSQAYTVAFPAGVTPVAYGSSGSPIAMSLSGITQGGDPSPGPALTVQDKGTGTTYALTNLGSGASPTGQIPLAGTYNTTSLGGTPTSIQAQLGSTAAAALLASGGSGWTTLSSQTISGGNWSGTLTGVSPGQYYVAVRAANGTAYANMSNIIRVGTVLTDNGEGNYGACFGSPGGEAGSALYGLIEGHIPAGNDTPLFGPPLVNAAAPSFAQAQLVNRYANNAAAGYYECAGDVAQAFWNMTGWPVAMIDNIADGVGVGIDVNDYATATQTIGIGDGTSTTWCSSSIYCGNHTSSNLVYTGASQTGATITGSVSTSGGVSTLNVSAINVGTLNTGGAIQPGLVLSGAGVTGSPTLVACVVVSSSSCNFNSTTSGTAVGSNWTLSSNQGTIASQAFTLSVSGGTPTPSAGFQANGTGPAGSGCCSGGYTPVILPGSFSVSVGGSVICSDSAASSVYSVQAGTCSGSGVTSSFINYATGAYSIKFSSAPANGAAINASWTNIQSGNWTGLPEAIGHVGSKTATTGSWLSASDKFPGGASAHVLGGGPSDYGPIGSLPFPAYPQWAIGYTQQWSQFYETQLPANFPNQQPVPILVASNWRGEGPAEISVGGVLYTESAGIDQWTHDSTSSSHFRGYITAGSPATLTLTATATGPTNAPMWEGEVIGCDPYSVGCAVGNGNVWISTLASGTWGASGSVYNLKSTTGYTIPSYGSSGSPVNLLNAVAFIDSPENSTRQPAFLVGPFPDDAVQFLAVGNGAGSHPTTGVAGGPRIGRRIGTVGAAYLEGGASQTTAAPATLSRPTIAACDASAISAPCFDIGSTYAASATTTSISGSVLTFNGLSANARPIVVGQTATCSGCSAGLYVVSVSNPPTQNTSAGLGQIGSANNGMTVTLNSSPGVSGAHAFTFSCSGTSGTGSNCIDVAIQVNTTGTYGGTAKGIATCGQGLQGSAVINTAPTGVCVDPGVGALVRDFRIGPSQCMGVGDLTSSVCLGDVWDVGLDPMTGKALQTSAFTCNLVANTSGIGIVQCVKTVTRNANGVPNGVGQWSSGSTFMAYGGLQVDTGWAGAFIGTVGGQSLAITTAGSGYTNGGPYTAQASSGSCGTFDGSPQPFVDLWVSGGSIVDVYPSGAVNQGMGFGVPGPCAFPAINNTNYPGIGAGSSGAIPTLTIQPNDGQGGIYTYINDTEMMGDLMYDNSGEPSNPNASFYAAPGTGTYFEPGQEVIPWGQFYGVAVSG